MISIILSNHFEDRSITLSKLNRAYNENKFEAIVLEMNYSIQMSILYNRIVTIKSLCEINRQQSNSRKDIE